MKKNISINISGIIFHIEEDGYSKLKGYLESINKYFSTYEDSQEIIADIESRVAEIFLTKLDEGKQIITDSDVSALIETMGTTSDFEAVEEDQDRPIVEEEQPPSTSSNEESYSEPKNEAPKRLIRDDKRRILGGVAAGIAHYFGIDPLWVRLVTVLLFLNIFVGALSGMILVAYIVLWVIVPGSYDLGEDSDIKKMYRDPDNSVLGGIASGIAAYFGTDVTIIRLVFIISTFLGGSGFIFYIILWMITPEAKSITEKMQMQGEPVTLSNIEQNVKENLNAKEGEESALVKILLFPFRVIAALFSALGRLLGPASKFAVEALRVLAGLFVTFIGLLVMVALFLSTGVVLGLISNWGGMVHVWDFPIDVVRGSFPTFGYVAVFAASFIPFLGLTLLGISILLKRFVLNAALGWAIFGVWVISMIGIAFAVPAVVSDFSSEGEYRETRDFSFGDEVVTLKLENEYLDEYYSPTLKLRGHEDANYKLDMKFTAYGSSRKEAVENAQMLAYTTTKNGDDLVFDAGLEFKPRSIFRAQELSMTLYIPYNQEFQMGEDMEEIIRYTINRSGYKTWQMEDNKWMFTEEGLKCLTCARSYSDDRQSRLRENREGDEEFSNKDRDTFERIGGEVRDFEIDDFSRIEVSGNFDVVITQGRTFDVQLKGGDRYLKRAYVKKFGDILEVSYKDSRSNPLRELKRKNTIKVLITLPELRAIKGDGTAQFTINDFDAKELKVELSGTSRVDMEVEVESLDLDLTGLTKVTMSGQAEYCDMRLTGAAAVRAYDFSMAVGNVSAQGGASARVRVTDKLYVEASGMSNVKYRGEAEVTVDNKGLSSVRRSVD